MLYEVDGVERSLLEWARVSGVPKTTLFHRVVTSGMTMTEVLKWGRGTGGKRLPQMSDGNSGGIGHPRGLPRRLKSP